MLWKERGMDADTYIFTKAALAQLQLVHRLYGHVGEAELAEDGVLGETRVASGRYGGRGGAPRAAADLALQLQLRKQHARVLAQPPEVRHSRGRLGNGHLVGGKDGGFGGRHSSEEAQFALLVLDEAGVRGAAAGGGERQHGVALPDERLGRVGLLVVGEAPDGGLARHGAPRRGGRRVLPLLEGALALARSQQRLHSRHDELRLRLVQTATWVEELDGGGRREAAAEGGRGREGLVRGGRGLGGGRACLVRLSRSHVGGAWRFDGDDGRGRLDRGRRARADGGGRDDGRRGDGRWGERGRRDGRRGDGRHLAGVRDVGVQGRGATRAVGLRGRSSGEQRNPAGLLVLVGWEGVAVVEPEGAGVAQGVGRARRRPVQGRRRRGCLRALQQKGHSAHDDWAARHTAGRALSTIPCRRQGREHVTPNTNTKREAKLLLLKVTSIL